MLSLTASTLTVLCSSTIQAQTFYEGHFYDVANQLSLGEFPTKISGYNEDLHGRLWFYFMEGYMLEVENDDGRLSTSDKVFYYYPNSILFGQSGDGEFKIN